MLAAGLGLLAFLGLTGYALDQAFADTALASQRERLQTYLQAYIARSEVTRANQIVVDEEPPEPRFAQPGDSGLYAAVRGANFAWESPSALERGLPFDLDLARGEVRFDGPLESPVGPIYRLGMGVNWEVGAEQSVDFTFFVAESAGAIERQISVFRRTLWAYLGGAGLLLLSLQTVMLRWSLRPLRRVVVDLARVERGESDRLDGRYPRELAVLTDSLNGFIESEREHLTRYRNTLGDLAHSLKTPLAVLRSRLDADTDPDTVREEVQQQVARMDDIVAYQLSRAATSGHQRFAAPLEIDRRAEELVRGLEKVYAGKGVYCEFELDPQARFHGEQGDLMELLGNLVENAFKWARQRVLLTTQSLPGAPGRRPGLLLAVDDDGPGIPPDKVERLLQRGVRGDERVQGHGIGLAIVQDIVRAYRGKLSVERSAELGGARFEIRIPPAA
jgi:two-component system, OmpR family, sensor histidine kinase PhoQ